MKNSKNFSSYDDLINYYGSVENIPSNVLAVVEDQGSQVLFSVSNNLSQSGEQYPEGGYNLDEEDREKLDYSYSTVQEIELSYASKDYVSDYVSQHGPDLTGYATESYVVGKIEDVVGVAPAALDTLKEIADSLNNDSDFAGTMTTALSNKADKSELNSYVKTSSLESMGYATQSYVADYVNTYGGNVDLTGYATESYVVNYVNTYGGGEDNVQADWNISDSSSDAYIKNKPDVSVGAGQNSVGIGNFSISELKGQYSVGAGNFTQTRNLGEVAFGKYNKSNKANDTFGNAGNTLFSVGNGDYIPRKNALEIMQNGDLYAYGIGNYDGKNYSSAYTLAYVINNQYVSKTELSAQSYALNDNVFIDIYANDRMNHWAATDYLSEAGILEYHRDNNQNPSSYWTIADLATKQYVISENINLYNEVTRLTDSLSDKILTNDYYTFNAGEGNNVDAINAALFETLSGGDPATEMYLYTSDYNWVNNQYAEDSDGNIILGEFEGIFEIDTDNKTARLENIPAGNYVILLQKNNPSGVKQGEFYLNYNGGSSIKVEYTDGNQLLDDKYFHPDHTSQVVFSWAGAESKYANFFFDKDVEYFEIKYVPGIKDNNNDVAAHYELDIKYKEYALFDEYLVQFYDSDGWRANGLTNIIVYNANNSEEGGLDTGTIVARSHWQELNDTAYEGSIGIGVVEYKDENENTQIVPAVIDTHWEVPESGTKSPNPVAPELKQTYKELVTKEYVDSLVGSAAALAETIVGDNSNNN